MKVVLLRSKDNKDSTDESSKEFSQIIVLTFIFFMGLHMLTPLLPLYIFDVVKSEFELGMVMSFFRGVVILTIIPFGIIANYIGKRLSLFISILFQLISYLLYATIQNPIFLYPITTLYAISLATFGPTAMTLALDLAPANKYGLVMSRYFTSIGLALVFGPLILSFIALHFNYQQIFLVASLLPILSIILFLSKYFKKDKINPFKDNHIEKFEIISLKSISKILFQRNILIMCVVQITFFISKEMFEVLFPVYSKEILLLTVSTISLLFVIRAVPNVIMRALISRLSNKIGNHKLMVFSLLMAFLSLFLIANMKDTLSIAFLIALYGVAWGGTTPLSATLMANNVKSNQTNIASSLVWLTGFIGMTMGSLMAGLATLILPLSAILKFSSFYVLLGSIIFLFKKKSE